jgi:Cof subfamily protein (haloacid dehalogenase superfamily)
MIKLVATDIDGTIFIPEKEFTQAVKDCISKLNNSGIKVVLVTGRMNAAASKIAQDLGLNTPVVSYQGGLVVENGKKLYERYLSAEQTERVLEWARKENIHINLYNDDILYSESECYEVQRYCNNLHTEHTVKKFSEIKKDKINKLLAIDYFNPDRISRYEKELHEAFPDLYIVKSTPYFLEFSNPEASKKCAVEFLQNYWGLKKEEILTIGDQNNDIALLKAGGLKIAMGNATDELKEIADYVTDSVYEDGFVKAIEKFCSI